MSLGGVSSERTKFSVRKSRLERGDHAVARDIGRLAAPLAQFSCQRRRHECWKILEPLSPVSMLHALLRQHHCRGIELPLNGVGDLFMPKKVCFATVAFPPSLPFLPPLMLKPEQCAKGRDKWNLAAFLCPSRILVA